MHIFLARQPIFDRNKNVIAYELLFRNGHENVYNSVDGDKATLKVIANSFYEFDFKSVSDDKKVFINFTEKLIKEEIATILPNNDVVIEILETIEPTKEVINACKKLKARGFILALDDFVFDKKYTELVKLIDIIKVDFIISKGIERKKIFDLLKINKNIKFLAEKVETMEEYNEALTLGYSYFQGYYFSKPVIMSAKSIPSNKHTALEIFRLINQKDFEFSKLEALILKDVGLSYKLTKILKSSAYCMKSDMTSIKYAIAFLGKKEIVKWLYVVLLNDLKEENANELIKISLQRARFCELICNTYNYHEKSFSAYIVGLFSVMDAILNSPMEIIIKDLYISEEVKDGLIKEGNIINLILKLSISYGKGNWEDAGEYAKEVNVDMNSIPEIYLETLKWADGINF
ncbi:EAL domain-containing protein [Clostridium sp. C2-6-12]|uniref:EAL and HDOD domain-containing protein n=1 Tax=Clostridium sp. C2-6-12 TaxID=2698832 RepID=UPI0013685241|nr:EAL domain-containing protein [Clostridium sp. C2-6-12]